MPCYSNCFWCLAASAGFRHKLMHHGSVAAFDRGNQWSHLRLKPSIGRATALAMKPGRLERDPLSSDLARRASVVDDTDLDAGPVLSTKKRAKVSEFVEKMGGKRTLQRILIANNGMAATKAILSLRNWAYMVLGE